jgi:hypothetical protein
MKMGDPLEEAMEDATELSSDGPMAVRDFVAMWRALAESGDVEAEDKLDKLEASLATPGILDRPVRPGTAARQRPPVPELSKTTNTTQEFSLADVQRDAAQKQADAERSCNALVTLLYHSCNTLVTLL